MLGPAAVPHQADGPLVQGLAVGLCGHDEERPARVGSVEQSKRSAETVVYLREPLLYLTFPGRATFAVEVVVDDEALAPVEVGGELVEVGVLGSLLTPTGGERAGFPRFRVGPRYPGRGCGSTLHSHPPKR